jgi:hypothetical protein
MLHFQGFIFGRAPVKWAHLNKEVAMLKKLILVLAGLTLAAPVFADGGHRHHRHKHHSHKHHPHWKHHSHHRPVVVMPPPRAYYAPRPRVYYAPPPRVYYAPPRPVYRAPAPASGVSIRLHFPL